MAGVESGKPSNAEAGLEAAPGASSPFSHFFSMSWLLRSEQKQNMDEAQEGLQEPFFSFCFDGIVQDYKMGIRSFFPPLPFFFLRIFPF